MGSRLPIPLDIAVSKCFPHGGVTKNTLLTAIRKGALGYEKIGNRFFVTESDIENWRSSQCRAPSSHRASTSESAPAGSLNTTSSTRDEKSALDTAEAMRTALLKSSASTSRATRGRIRSNVIPLKSKSQT